jgi:hypothetical protein
LIGAVWPVNFAVEGEPTLTAATMEGFCSGGRESESDEWKLLRLFFRVSKNH